MKSYITTHKVFLGRMLAFLMMPINALLLYLMAHADQYLTHFTLGLVVFGYMAAMGYTVTTIVFWFLSLLK